MEEEISKNDFSLTPSSKNFYLTISDFVKQFSRLPNTDELNLTKQARNYYIRKLKAEGIIRKIGYGTWEILSEKIPQEINKEVKKIPKGTHHRVKNVFTFERKIRGHGFIVSFLIPKLPNWNKREEYLKRINQEYLPINKINQRIIFRGFKVWLCSKKIVIYTPKSYSYFSVSAKDCKNYAISDILELFKGIENLLNCSLKVNGSYRFKVNRQHYGKVNDAIANFYDRENKKLEIRNERGVWALVDKSMKFTAPEFETVNKDSAVNDMDKVIIPFMNDLKGHYEQTGESLKASDLLKISNQIALNQKEYADNIKSHIEAIRKLGEGVEKLTDLIAKRG